LERFNWDEAAYDSYIRAKLLADTEKLELEDSFDKGKTEGKAEGKLEGKLEIAKNLIAKGFDENAILELTGFTKQEIKKYFN
jgi:predicted transposase/invertase (TIGR01784 family)